MIISSAIKLKNGSIYVGLRHCNCYDSLRKIKNDITLHVGAIEGFLTDKLKFLNREQAYYHALKNNQCKDLSSGVNKEKIDLYSEDLW